MHELYGNFQVYLHQNFSGIKWVFLFGVLFYTVFYFLQVKGYTKNCRKMVVSKVCRIILSLNCSFIFVMTLFGRRIGENCRFDLKPFNSYYYGFTEGDMEMLLQIIMNVAMYIPLGFLLPCYFKVFEKYRYVVLVATISSLFIELTQAIFKMGLFEVDDIINNTIGAIGGLLIYILCVQAKKHRGLCYLVFGALTTAVNILVYTSYYYIFEINNSISNIIAWISSVVFAYITNKLWVFNNWGFKIQTLLREVLTFSLSRLVTGVLDIIVMYVLVDVWGLTAWVIKIISNIIVIILNYFASKQFVFVNTRKDSD